MHFTSTAMVPLTYLSLLAVAKMHAVHCQASCSYSAALTVALRAVQIKINLLTFFFLFSAFCFHSQANPQVHQLGWLFNGNELKQNEDDNIKIRNNSILINNVKRAHIGAYQCHGKNPLGQSVSDEFGCSSIRPVLTAAVADSAAVHQPTDESANICSFINAFSISVSSSFTHFSSLPFGFVFCRPAKLFILM